MILTVRGATTTTGELGFLPSIEAVRTLRVKITRNGGSSNGQPQSQVILIGKGSSTEKKTTLL